MAKVELKRLILWRTFSNSFKSFLIEMPCVYRPCLISAGPQTTFNLLGPLCPSDLGLNIISFIICVLTMACLFSEHLPKLKLHVYCCGIWSTSVTSMGCKLWQSWDRACSCSSLHPKFPACCAPVSQRAWWVCVDDGWMMDRFSVKPTVLHDRPPHLTLL